MLTALLLRMVLLTALLLRLVLLAALLLRLVVLATLLLRLVLILLLLFPPEANAVPEAACPTCTPAPLLQEAAAAPIAEAAPDTALVAADVWLRAAESRTSRIIIPGAKAWTLLLLLIVLLLLLLPMLTPLLPLIMLLLVPVVLAEQETGEPEAMFAEFPSNTGGY